MPCRTKTYGPTQCDGTVAANPDRYLSAAIIGIIIPCRAHGPNVVVGQFATPLEGYAERLEFLPSPPRAHTEDQPAAAELMKVGRASATVHDALVPGRGGPTEG